MTGAYLFRQVDGKKIPTEVEYLTDEERHNILKDRDAEEVIRWLNLVCDTLVENILMMDEDRNTMEKIRKETK